MARPKGQTSHKTRQQASESVEAALARRKMKSDIFFMSKNILPSAHN